MAKKQLPKISEEDKVRFANMIQGEMITNFSHVELYMNLIIAKHFCKEAGKVEDLLVILDFLNTETKLKILTFIVTKHYPKYLDEDNFYIYLKEKGQDGNPDKQNLITTIRQAMILRNKFAHGIIHHPIVIENNHVKFQIKSIQGLKSKKGKITQEAQFVIDLRYSDENSLQIRKEYQRMLVTMDEFSKSL